MHKLPEPQAPRTQESQVWSWVNEEMGNQRRETCPRSHSQPLAQGLGSTPFLGTLGIGVGGWENSQLPETIACVPASSKLGVCSVGGLLLEENT